MTRKKSCVFVCINYFCRIFEGSLLKRQNNRFSILDENFALNVLSQRGYQTGLVDHSFLTLIITRVAKRN